MTQKKYTKRWACEWKTFDNRMTRSFFVLPTINYDWWDGYKLGAAWLFWGVTITVYSWRDPIEEE